MSLHYEWILSLRLRPDTPERFVEELRYHLGLSDLAPEVPTLDVDGAALAAYGDGDELAGGPITRLVQQQNGTWAVFVRIFVLDDAMYDLVQVVPQWLARWSLTQGWIGFAREELNLHPWLTFYVADRFAYAAPPGKQPEPFTEQAPPFILTQTTEPWPPRT
jgi:hypothetical protein